MMLQDLFLVFFYYGIGTVGSLLLWCTAVYTTSVLYHTLIYHKISVYESLTKFEHIIWRLYKYLGVDWYTADLYNVPITIPIEVVIIMCILAGFGTITFVGSIIVGFIGWMSMLMFQFINKTSLNK